MGLDGGELRRSYDSGFDAGLKAGIEAYPGLCDAANELVAASGMDYATAWKTCLEILFAVMVLDHA